MDPNNRTRIGARRTRRAIYSIALALLCAAPITALVATAPEGYLAALPFLSFAGGSYRAVGFAFAAAAFICVGIFTYKFLGQGPAWLDRCDRIQLPRLLRMKFDRKGILTTAAIIFVFWIPVLIVLYPCATTTYDTIDELYQALSDPPIWYFSTNTVVDASIIDHHPWFDTIVFGAFAWLGKGLGSIAVGMFLYGLVQMLASALIMATSLCYLERLRVPNVLRVVALAIVAIFPVFSVTADTMQKDSLFSLVYLVYTLMYFEAFRTRGEALKRRRFLIGFAITIALCILTKKTGIYITCASTIVLIIALKGVRIQSLASFAMPAVVCMAILPAALFPVLNIAPGGNQEMLGILYQQSITVLQKDPDSVTDEQREALEGVLDVDSALGTYRSDSTDYVKQWAREEATSSEVSAFLSTWAALGISHPGLYIQSMSDCFGPLLVPSKSLLINSNVSQKGIEFYERHDAEIGGTFKLDVVSPPALQNICNALDLFYLNTLRRIPVISLFFTMGFYDAWIPLFALIVALYCRKRRDACALAPVIISALFLLVSPTALARYAICMVFLAIPTVGWAIRCLREPRKSR